MTPSGETVPLVTMRATSSRTKQRDTKARRSIPFKTLYRDWWGAAIVLAAFGCLVITGFVGLNFGFHWDEPVQFRAVNATVRTGSFLPNRYDYPSVTYLLSLLGVLPRVLRGIRSHAVITSSEFYVHARAVFLVATSVGGLWLYLALRRRAGELGAAFGAATYLLSFQLAYHARWIAPDAVLASAVALFLWFFAIAWDSPNSTWRTVLPAIAAGVATATKYQGAVLMVPVVVLLVARWRAAPATIAVQLRILALSIAGFFVTFFILTPGAILQHRIFITDVRLENKHYHTGHEAFHGVVPYEVRNHFRYLWLLTRYVVVSLPSHSPAISFLVIALAILGAVTLVRREPWFAIATMLPCLIVALYFSSLVVFIVRNFLLLLPFVAYFVGVGVGRASEFARTKVTFSVLAAFLCVVMALNGAWLVHAAQTIKDRSPAALVRESDSYMRARPGTSFVLSRQLYARFLAQGEALPHNVRTSGPADYLVVLYSQIENGHFNLRQWPATSSGTYHAIGPLEVDFNYYPTWAGADRVLVFSPKAAQRFGLTRAELHIGL